MNNNLMEINSNKIKDLIYTIRGKQVMIDSDLAIIYGYEVKRLNEQVKRNIGRFPDDFMFRLTREEFDFVKSQFATSRKDTDFLDKVVVVVNYHLFLRNKAFICWQLF